ncbi:hypothetical protein A3K63_01190 [Candidatus Micrarchaeota archaeon RBG_16_49_10]|nr:MAG: hypothetical protein A3K63_01190 [Candidatus Micrarchaeota archaeon RBG_16_49_10]
MVSWKTRMKAYWLAKQGKVKKDIENERRIFFTVETGGEEKSVIYEKAKNKWSCDCQFFSLKFTDCSHIKAAKQFLEGEDAGKRLD